MKSFWSDRKLSRVVFAAMLGVVLVAGCASISTPVQAADDDDDEELLDVKAIKGFLKALGLRRDDGQQNINYRERSPLVLPNNKDLPSPEANSAPKVAGWPDDPDIKREKKRKEAKRNRKAYVEGVDDRPLLPSQYGQGSGTVSSGPVTPNKDISETSRPSSLTELGSKSIFSVGSIFAPKKEVATFTGEPRREALTDPPPGYRTPSPNQPYGLGAETTRPTALNPSAIHDDITGK